MKMEKFIKNQDDESEEKMLDIMIRHNLPFSFFDDKDVKDIYALAYGKELKSRDHFRRVVLEKKAKKIRDGIKTLVGDDYNAVTSDGWSQPTRSPALQRFH